MNKFAKIGISFLLLTIVATAVSASTEEITPTEENKIVTFEFELSPDF